MTGPETKPGAPAHAFLPPSGAAAWVACANWPTMNARYPDAGGDESAEGTAAHWAFGEILFGRVIAEGQIAPNGVTLTEEMIEGAELYVDTIDAALAAAGLDRSALMVERRVYMPQIHAQNDGTPDTWFYDRNRGRVELFDFKFGHRYVEVFENWQLINYSAGILHELGIDGVADQHLRMRLTIVQPRSYVAAGPVRSWEFVACDLRPYFNKLAYAARVAFSPDRQATPNDECRYCPGRHACTALQATAYEAADLAGASTPLELEPAALGLELRMLQRAQRRLEARISGLEATVEDRLKRGDRVPFFALEPTTGREKWARPLDEVLALGQLFGANLAKPAALTPKQAVKAGLPAAVVAAYVAAPTTGVQLVASNGDAAAKVFR